MKTENIKTCKKQRFVYQFVYSFEDFPQEQKKNFYSPMVVVLVPDSLLRLFIYFTYFVCKESSCILINVSWNFFLNLDRRCNGMKVVVCFSFQLCHNKDHYYYHSFSRKLFKINTAKRDMLSMCMCDIISQEFPSSENLNSNVGPSNTSQSSACVRIP